MNCIHALQESEDRLVLVIGGLKFWVSKATKFVDHLSDYMDVFILGLLSGDFNSSGYIILNDGGIATQ